jgi:hypothetical protein
VGNGPCVLVDALTPPPPIVPPLLVAPLSFMLPLPFAKLMPRCHNPNLGLTTKARVCKSAGQEKDLGVWESVKMNIHTPK